MYDYGSGTTIADYYYKDPFRFSIHEFAHYLLGGNQFHNGHGFWAMLSGYEVRSYMVNAYERYRLGWCNLITVNTTTQTISNATLPDFITTGVAYRIDINPALNQFFFIENHQKISIWDKCSKTDYPDDKGLFVIRQDFSSSQSTPPMAADWMWMNTADGRYNWEVNQWTPNLWGDGELPVFKKLNANRETGYHELEFVPFTYNGQNYDPYEIIFLEDQYGNPYQYPTRQGRGKDAFRLDFNEVFSPWSNPNSQNKDRGSTGIGFKVNSVINGLVTFDIYVNQSITAPPSKPQNLTYTITSDRHPKLIWDGNLEPDMYLYKIYRYNDLNSNPINIGIINHTPGQTSFNFIDVNVTVPRPREPAGDYKFYRVSTLDNQWLESVKSEYVVVISNEQSEEKIIGDNVQDMLPAIFSLDQNYPNPFNPSTTISFSIPEKSFVTLKIYDMLGREVVELVNEELETGNFEKTFDASSLASGVYIYRISAMKDGKILFNESKQMLLIK